MPQFSEASVNSVVEKCKENSAALAESLNLCFDRKYRLSIGISSKWSGDSVPEEILGPGLVVAFRVGSQGAMCLIPETLPIPDWCSNPGASEQARLDTLAMEWSLNVLPTGMEADGFATLRVNSLKESIEAAKPVDWYTTLELLLHEEASPDEEKPIAKLHLVWPVEQPPVPAASGAGDQSADRSAGAETTSETVAEVGQSSRPVPSAAKRRVPMPKRAALMQLPVTVSVRLGERKIELGQLLSLTPGSLITFNKSCEEFLDLYVNETLYCRGEAVKIGEKFGLKICEVGAVKKRMPKVVGN